MNQDLLNDFHNSSPSNLESNQELNHQSNIIPSNNEQYSMSSSELNHESNQEFIHQSNSNEQSNEQKESLVLRINKNELDFIKILIGGSKRFYFRHDFSTLLSHKLQNEYNIKCWFKSVYDWIKKSNSQKDLSPYWYGNYKCIDKNCHNTLRAFIFEKLDKDGKDDILIHVYMSKTKIHRIF
jgi:hypothetical protein